MSYFDRQKEVMKKHLRREYYYGLRMVVSGKKISDSRARDFVFRTEDHLSGLRRLKEEPVPEEYTRYWEGSKIGTLLQWARYCEESQPASLGGDDFYALRNTVSGYLGHVDSGPFGNVVLGKAGDAFRFTWLHPDGTIYGEKYIGASMSIYDILLGWEVIASAFPYLDMHVTLISDNRGLDIKNRDIAKPDGIPLMNFRVSEGTVEPCAPDMAKHRIPKVIPRYDNRLPDKWYTFYQKKVRREVESQLEDMDFDPEARTFGFNKRMWYEA